MTPQEIGWSLYIQERLPEIPEAVVKKITAVFIKAGFFSPVTFSSLSFATVASSRFDGETWEAVDEVLWEHMLQLHKNLPVRRPGLSEATQSDVAPSETTGLSPALVMAGAFKVSVTIRSGQILNCLMGVPLDRGLPEPHVVMNNIIKSPAFQAAKEKGLAREFLSSLVDQRLMESLAPDSRISYVSGVHSWVHFCDMVGIPPHLQLKVKEDDVCTWMSLHRKASTARSYKSHLRMACILAKEPTDWNTDRVRAVLKSLDKGEGVNLEKKKWVCSKELLHKLVEVLKTEPGMSWLRVLSVLSYHFQFRVFSEPMVTVYEDIRFEGLNKPLGQQSLVWWLNGRKNRPNIRHPLKRSCCCTQKNDQGICSESLCPVHVVLAFLESDPLWRLFQSSGTLGLRFMSDVKKAWVNPSLKSASQKAGDPDWRLASSHGFRRGAACDLALAGKELRVILQAGDWRSAAFREYIRSVQNDLAARAMVGLMGNTSDSDGEAA